MRIFMITACAIMMATLLPASLHALELSEPDNGKNVSLPLARTLSITLSGNPTTGYTWEQAALDQKILAMEPGPSFVPNSSLIGAGGIFTFRFVPRKSGTSTIKLVYHRPWEKAQPLRVFALTVTIAPAGEGVNYAVYRSSTGEILSAAFDLGRKQVTVNLPDGRVVTLSAAVSASGARYSDGTETFWEHQGTASFFQGEKLLFEGTILDNEEDQTDSCRECQ